MSLEVEFAKSGSLFWWDLTVQTVPYFEFVILMRFQGAIDDWRPNPNIVELVRLLAFKRHKNQHKRRRPRRVMNRFCRARIMRNTRWIHFLLNVHAFYRFGWHFWEQHELDESITRLGWRLRRRFWRRLRDDIFTIQTTPKLAKKASMAPSYDCFEISAKFVVSSSLFWWVSNGPTPVR